MLCEMIKDNDYRIVQRHGNTLYINGAGTNYPDPITAYNAFNALLINSVVEGWIIRQHYC